MGGGGGGRREGGASMIRKFFFSFSFLSFLLLFNLIQFKNFNHPERGDFVVVMAGS